MKNKKSKWTSKPTKSGWYWIRYKRSGQCKMAGLYDKQRELFMVGYDDIGLERLWPCEFHPVTAPK